MGPGPHRRRRFRPPESTNDAPEIPRRLPPLWWTRLRLINGVGVLALVPPFGPDRGTRRLDDHDAYRTQPARAQARRADERSRIAADHGGNRRPTTPEAPATGRFPDQGRPVRSERSPPRVPDASARLARHFGPGLRPCERRRSDRAAKTVEERWRGGIGCWPLGGLSCSGSLTKTAPPAPPLGSAQASEKRNPQIHDRRAQDGSSRQHSEKEPEQARYLGDRRRQICRLARRRPAARRAPRNPRARLAPAGCAPRPCRLPTRRRVVD